jgi:hypothetical protein
MDIIGEWAPIGATRRLALAHEDLEVEVSGAGGF